MSVHVSHVCKTGNVKEFISFLTSCCKHHFVLFALESYKCNADLITELYLFAV